jgi:molybdate transport system ATP-binding protein
MSLDATLALSLGPLDLDVHLQVASGTITAIVGPNGAGKTTLLRTLAGLIIPDRGRVLLGGELLEDTDRDLSVPTERRAIAMVFQDHQLFVDLSVRENVAFGLRARGVRRAEARRVADAWLARVGLEGTGDRRPDELSGGQTQRVALARSLAISPSLLLLDEPLAALDAETRTTLRPELRDHLRTSGIPTLMVTHDPDDARLIADHIVVLEAGRITQQGALSDLAADPRSAYVRELTRSS